MNFQWQDVLLSTCILGFNIALIPTIFSRHKPHAGTGLLTAFFQIVAFVVYVSLALWFSATMAMLNAVLWSIIVLQRLTQKKKARPKMKQKKQRPLRARV